MSSTFFLGEWQVEPAANTLRQGKQLVQLEPKAMDVLQLLCRHAGEVISSDDIVSQCWPQAETGDNPLHKIINQLRRALGDTATDSAYIETIRKRGYRVLAEVRFPLGQEAAVAAHLWQDGSPFPGLQAFDLHHAKVFYGRGAQIDTLLQRIAQQIQYGRAFCLLLGPSGSGKSSLINAGVMPNLMQAGGYNGVQVLSYSDLDLADVAPQQLLTDLASAMLDWDYNDHPVFDGESAQSLAEQLALHPEQVMSRCVQLLPKNAPTKQRFALFVDRLEVLLSSPLFSDAERRQFTLLLEQLATSGAVLVLSACRNEFYPLLVDYPSLIAGKAKGAHFDLAAPGRTELLQMIRLPALAAGLSFDIDADTAMPLDEVLCSEAASNPDALPMLQYTLQELYLQRSTDNKLLMSVYKTLGGIEGAIGKNAEQAINSLNDKQKASLPKVLSLLVTLREDETSITSRSARWSQLQNEQQQALAQTMVEQRLFVSHLQNGEACFSIAHEALLRRWPRATNWISEHHDSLSIRSRLQHLTQRWLSEQKNSAYLLAEGKPLQEAQTLVTNQLFSLDADERSFLHASASKARLKRWVRRGTVTLLSVLTVTSITMSVKSYNAEQQAQQKRLAAENLLGFMVGEFADKLRSIARMDLLDGISNKALEYFSDFSSADDHLTSEARLQHGQTLEAMGEVAYSRGKTDEAVSALQAARAKLVSVLAGQPNNLELLKTLGANAFWLAQIHYDASNWQDAKPEFELYYQYSERMFELAPDNVDAIMELSYATNSLGSLAMKQQQFAAARESFEESLRLKLLVQKQQPNNNQLRADVADTRSWLASAASSLGDVPKAIAIHLQLQQELGNTSLFNDPYLLERLAGSYQIVAYLLDYQGQSVQAYEKAKLGDAAISMALQQDPKNGVWKRQKLFTLIQLLRTSSAIGLPVNEQDFVDVENALKADSGLFSANKNNELWASYRLAMAAILLKDQQISQSKMHAESALLAYEKLSDKYAQNMQYLASLSQTDILLARIFLAENNPVESQRYCQSVVDRLAPLIEQNKDPRFSLPYVIALDCLGQLTQHPELLALMQHAEISDINFTKPQ